MKMNEYWWVRIKGDDELTIGKCDSDGTGDAFYLKEYIWEIIASDECIDGKDVIRIKQIDIP